MYISTSHTHIPTARLTGWKEGTAKLPPPINYVVRLSISPNSNPPLTFIFGIRYNGSRLMRDDITGFLPLSPATLHILLSLAAEDLHGYAIMQEVSRQSEGKYKLGPGTLYDNLQKLVQRRFVQELGTRTGDEDPRRRYYRLTSLGRGVLEAETVRLSEVVREARLRLQIAKPRRA